MSDKAIPNPAVGETIMPVDTTLIGYVTNPKYPGVKLLSIIFQSKTEGMATMPLAFSEAQALDLLDKLQDHIEKVFPSGQRYERHTKLDS